MVFTERDRFIANCDRVTVADSIDSNRYQVTITANTIVVDSVKELDQCSELDIYNYINMIHTKITKRRQNNILYGITYMESYIDKIINKNFKTLLLASTKFKYIDLTPHHCTVMMTMHRWTKRPKTVYESIRIMVYCVYRQWKLTLNSITVLARLTDSNQQKAFFPMGFRFKEYQGQSNILTLDWKLYTKLSQTPSDVEYIFK